jgi:hypothetical protein
MAKASKKVELKVDGKKIKEAVKQVNEESLKLILKPFADWAWGDPVKADAVIDKYFKQVINK